MRAPASFARSPITTSSQRSGTRSWNARVGANRRHVSAGSSVTFFVPSVTAAFDRSRGMASAEPPSNERCSNVLPRKTNTTVGIAIPAYKRGHHLAATLESALRQTRPADEIVIVDDCSPDNTRDVALAYASRGVRYVRNAVNFGVPENYNVSIDQLTSDYVFILEDHDLLAPTFVERCATALDQHPDANLAFTDIAEIDEHGSVIRENRFNRPAVIPSAAFAKDLVTMVGAIFGLTAMIRRTALEGL